MSMFSIVKGGIAAAGLMAVSLTAAQAAPLYFELTDFTGNDSRIGVTVDQLDANTLQFSLNQPIQGAEQVGELRAFYFHVANEALLPGLSISGADVTNWVVGANSISEVTPPPNFNDTNVNPGGPFDVGVAFGSAGQDNPSIDTTTFNVAHAGGLTLESFFPDDGLLFGGRIKPFADGGSSKLSCDYPCGSNGNGGGPNGSGIPVPGALALLGVGMIGLGMARRRRSF